jgi:DEAD/DEAH box helicase domain-containing protein
LNPFSSNGTLKTLIFFFSKNIVESFLSQLKKIPLGQLICFHQRIPARPSRWGRPAVPFPEPIQKALIEKGITRLYSHQVEALEKIQTGDPVIISTPTASGKSLIYILASLLHLLEDPCSKALYLFPIKALEQDQRKILEEWTAGLPFSGKSLSAIYDGDTPVSQRKKIRQAPPPILISNPDMLHMGILPYHEQWKDFFKDLKLVVIDEAHVYKGILGSHLVQIIRRLRRICRLYQSDPQFILSSATIARPELFSESLTGLSFQAVQESGYPSQAKHFLFMNPDISASVVGARLFTYCLSQGKKTILFTQGRRVTELIHMWVEQMAPALKGKISSYRAGFLPEERRIIERKLASGELLGVITTSALEMGIDIGSLDVCVLVGYPGSIINTWQRGGRVGRSRRESAIILIAQPDALDQYFIRHPEDFFQRSFETAVVDPDNSPILKAHLTCAAAEFPLSPEDPFLQPSRHLREVRELEKEGRLLLTARGEEWVSAKKNPHREVNIRSIGEAFTILNRQAPLKGIMPAQGRPGHHDPVGFADLPKRLPVRLPPGVSPIDRHSRSAGSQDMKIGQVEYLTSSPIFEPKDKKGAVIGTLDRLRAFRECHPGAIYLHKAEAFLVERLELKERNVYVTRREVNYYTRIVAQKETEIIQREQVRPVGNFLINFGQILVTETFTGYEKRAIHGQELLGVYPLDLPPQTFETEGLWIEIEEIVQDQMKTHGFHIMGGLHALEHGTISIFPLYALCDRGDIGGICYPHHPQVGKGAIFIYDGYPGGVGLAKRGYDIIEGLLEKTLDLISECPCEAGCPSCIHSPQCGSGNKPLDKAGALYLIQLLLGQIPLMISERQHPSPMETLKGLASQATDPGHPRIGFFDLETQRLAEEVGGWGNKHLMRLSVGVVYDSQDNRFHHYHEGDIHPLIEHLKKFDLVIGFNVKNFDYGVLKGYSSFDFNSLPTLDLLEDVFSCLGFRLSLDHLAHQTLGAQKSGDGLQAVQWFREGQWEPLTHYCRQDVKITKSLFEFGQEKGHVLFEDKAGQRLRCPVDWSEGRVGKLKKNTT